MLRSAFLTALCALASPLSAQSFGAGPDVIDVEVLPGWKEPGMEHIAALRLSLAPGWKTYWRAPGDAGIPPMFDWTGSSNVAEVRPHWPVPEIFNQNGMRSIGYENEVVIPLHITRENANEPIRLTAEVSIGVCEEICVPAMVRFDTMLPAQGAADQDISAAMADRPMTEAEAGVTDVVCSIEPISDGLALTVSVTMPPFARGEESAIETSDPTVWVAEPAMARVGDVLTATTELVRYDGVPFALDRSGVRMTVFGGNQAVDIRGCRAG
ncbi:MAG: protein-disulfide reductase DsbD domain-containing protein [Pseudomonadota bacterium]